jgi:hypothetical protein
MSLTTHDLNMIIHKVVLAYSAVCPCKKQNLLSTWREVHRVADSTYLETSPDASTAATLYTLLNHIKIYANTHFAAATYHRAADATNSVDATDASTEATAITLVNELKLDINAHMIQSGVHMADDTADRITIADAVDFATCYLLANQIKSKFNTHLSAQTDGRWVHVKDVVDAAEIDATSGSGVTRSTIRQQIRTLIPNLTGGTSVTTYTITSTTDAQGTITPLGEVAVDSGESQEFAVDAVDEYYLIAGVSVDGEFIDKATDPNWITTNTDGNGMPISGTYTFTDVTADHTIDIGYQSPS